MLWELIKTDENRLVQNNLQDPKNIIALFSCLYYSAVLEIRFQERPGQDIVTGGL